MKTKLAAFFLPLALTALACGDDADTATTATSGPTTTASTGTAGGGGMGGGTSTSTGAAGGGGMGGGTGGAGGQGGADAFVLTSPVFAEGAVIPLIHECESGGGQNTSPPLSWTPGPVGTQSYAVVMRDLDFQNGFLHWVIWDIPATTEALPQDVEQTYQPADPAGAKQAPFNGAFVGYYGPCSPNVENTYEFTVYAIDVATLPGLDQNSTKLEAELAIIEAATASAKLAGES